MKITRNCCLCGNEHTMDLDVTHEQLDEWQSGEVIQRVMPDLSVSEREFLITGMTPEEQEAFYSRLEE